MQIDFKSFLIGILTTALFFILSGFEDSSNFGDIVVNSITIKDDGHGGFISAALMGACRNAMFLYWNPSEQGNLVRGGYGLISESLSLQDGHVNLGSEAGAGLQLDWKRIEESSEQVL